MFAESAALISTVEVDFRTHSYRRVSMKFESIFALVGRGTRAASNPHVRCSFCGRDRDAVNQLVSGPSVYICDRCVDIATQIIAESRANTLPKPE